jgi:hypothetical protein
MFHRDPRRLQEELVTSATALPESANPVPWLSALLAAIVAAILILKITPLAHPWPQNYDPTGHWWLSALVAALPILVLLGTLGLLHMKALYSALLGLATSLICSILMAAANSCGGVMGKMIDALSIVVASTATEWYGHEGDILRYVFFHSIALAALVGIMVTLQANQCPFTRPVVR